MSQRVDAAPRRPRVLRGASTEMNHAADEYDDARPGLGDEFLATVETAFNGIVRIRSVLPVGDSSHLAG